MHWHREGRSGAEGASHSVGHGVCETADLIEAFLHEFGMEKPGNAPRIWAFYVDSFSLAFRLAQGVNADAT